MTEYLEEFDEAAEAKTREFLAGRYLPDFNASLTLFKAEHDVRLAKELKYQDTRLLRYRIDMPNEISRCDTKFQNNLHFYYGDGSNLGKGNGAKHHYAMDQVNTTDDDDAKRLKAVKIAKKREEVNEWLEDVRRRQPFLMRRSYSDLQIFPESASDNTAINTPERRPLPDWFNESTRLYNFTDAYIMPCPNNTYFNISVTRTFESISRYVKVKHLPLGWIGISKILFTTNDLHGYAIDSNFDVNEALLAFSKRYKDFLDYYNANGKTLSHKWEDWRYRNVVICLEEYHEKKTEYRRARHILSNYAEHYFVELDTGNFVTLYNVDKVSRMQTHFTYDPPALFEFRFKDVETCAEMSEQVERVRKTGRMKIIDYDDFKRCPPKSESRFEKPKTFVIAKMRDEMPKRLHTRLFCEDPQCSMMCNLSHVLPPVLNAKSQEAWDY